VKINGSIWGESFSINRQRKMVDRSLVDPFIDHAFYM